MPEALFHPLWMARTLPPGAQTILATDNLSAMTGSFSVHPMLFALQH